MYHESATFRSTPLIPGANQLLVATSTVSHSSRSRLSVTPPTPKELAGIRELRPVHTCVPRIGHFWKHVINSLGKSTFGGDLDSLALVALALERIFEQPRLLTPVLVLLRRGRHLRERKVFIGSLLVRIQFIILIILADRPCAMGV